jgi:hypothetical protein
MSEVNDGFDDGQGGGGEAEDQQVDPNRNMKAEFDRKIQNVMDTTNQRLQEIAQMLKPAQQAEPDLDYADLKSKIYDDPGYVIKQIEERADRRAEAAANRIVNNAVQKSTASQQAVNEVAMIYPEFTQPGSTAAQRAVEIGASQDPSLRGTAAGVKLAMMQAAAEQGLTPASARRQQPRTNTDDFSVGERGGSGQRQQRRQQDPTKDIDPKTLEFAALLGVDINDPKRLEGLQRASQRKYNKYQ